MNHDELLDRVKLKAFVDSKNTFLNCVLFSHKFEEISEGTAATNGLTLYINPAFFAGLASDAHRVSLLKHEAWHTAFKHPVRGAEKDQKIWGMALDYFVNNLLVKDRDPLPTPDGLYDAKYDGWTEEQIYEDLLSKNEPEPQDNFNGQDVIQAKEDSKEKETLEQKIDQTLISASIQAKISNDAGSIPGNIERQLDDLLNPKLPWYVLLQNHLHALAKTDFSWSRPNRRALCHDMYLPSEIGEGMGKMNTYLDASGSVGDREFDAYRTEIYEAIQSLNPETVTVAEFDTKLHTPVVLQQGENILDMKFSGYGGTDIKPVIEHIIKDAPDVAIVFTDGHFYPYHEQVADHIHTPIIWVIVDNPSYTTTVGTVVHMEI